MLAVSESEYSRLRKLREYFILDTAPEQVFDDITALAALICGTPIALITLLDSEREWIKAAKGLTVCENPRNNGFCEQTIQRRDLMIVPDALEDSRFAGNPLVEPPSSIRFYAGMPVRAAGGEALGTLCVLDTVARQLSPHQASALRALARQVETALELRRKDICLAHAQSETQRSELRLSLTLDARNALLSSANVAIIATDEQGIIVTFNRAAQRMLGYSEEEVAGKYTPELFHDADEIAARFNLINNGALPGATPSYVAIAAETRTGIADEREWTYVRKDGSRFPVRVSITPLRAPDGTINGYLKIAIDITPLKAAEELLKKSERFTRSVLNALSKRFYVLDAAGNLLAENKPWLNFEQQFENSGQTLEIGQNFVALLNSEKAEDKGGPAFADGVRSVLNGEKNAFALEYTFHSQAIQYWFTGKAIPFPDQELGRVIVIYENISDHKRLEHRFRQAVESAPNAIVMVNEAGTILLVNAQTEMSFGYQRNELLGQPVEILVPERMRGRHSGFRQNYFAAPQSRPMGVGRELFGLRKDGSEFPVEIGLSLIDNHEETLVLSSIVDITERKRLEQCFRQAVESAPNAIVMVNEAGTILLANAQAEASFGYPKNEMIGLAIEILVPERFRNRHAGFRQSYFAVPQSRPMGAGRELYGLRKDGSEFPVEIGLALIDDGRGTIVLSSIVDITERKNASDVLKRTLNEKEMLLKEVYHRVKNNLQVVSSLINLQAKNVQNKAAVGLLRQSADRIKAMALLHEKLYQSKDLARIDFNSYIRSLVDHLVFGYAAQSNRIKINLHIENIALDLDTAIPCGLIINELLSNALKHAFPDDRQGEIGISFMHELDEFVLIINDNGVGIPADLDISKSSSLGLQLVSTLTNQLLGRMSLDRSDGTAFTIRFSTMS